MTIHGGNEIPEPDKSLFLVRGVRGSLIRSHKSAVSFDLQDGNA